MRHSMPVLVQIEEIFDPMKKNYFQNKLFAKFANFRVK